MRTSLYIFDTVGIAALRKRSEKLTGYLEGLLDEVTATRPLKVTTPRDPQRRGAQMSVRVSGMRAADPARTLRHEHGVVVDAREPDIIRLAPVPLYSTFHDCWRVADALAHSVSEER
ncbi:hypothetical protein RKE30_11145 [Streptomyces sp. Li-HN-5-11]|uniref:kynureninase/PvdN C-terminal domain-containing protein n=1 Tax=Streptomyces sp. Li-HN-5-11 TaxID=3075432 RepID=UPI0028A63ABB|nr:hypothetical protein [Streptomyces sp. Li-HN-5-11]WNM30922.1 hypothetical protein RKE30_11145 [Streptomyces sp. Li-HN-5-11]